MPVLMTQKKNNLKLFLLLLLGYIKILKGRSTFQYKIIAIDIKKYFPINWKTS